MHALFSKQAHASRDSASMIRRKEEDSHLTPLSGRTPLSKQVRGLARFSFPVFLMAEERGLAPRTRGTECRPFSKRRRALAQWLLRAEGGGLDPHTAVAVRVAFQASSIPDGFTFHGSGRRDSNSRSPASQTGAFAKLSYVLKGPV